MWRKCGYWGRAARQHESLSTKCVTGVEAQGGGKVKKKELNSSCSADLFLKGGGGLRVCWRVFVKVAHPIFLFSPTLPLWERLSAARLSHSVVLINGLLLLLYGSVYGKRPHVYVHVALKWIWNIYIKKWVSDSKNVKRKLQIKDLVWQSKWMTCTHRSSHWCRKSDRIERLKSIILMDAGSYDWQPPVWCSRI